MRPLRTYDDWKHCISEICKIPLTEEFVRRRLTELGDTQNHNTQKFVSTWGENHRKQIVTWLEMAERELAQSQADQ